MGRVIHIMKYMLCSFNLLFMFLGLQMLIIGVVFQLDWTVVKDALKSYMTVAPLVFIIIGTLMFVIAIFGFCGPIFESQFMIITYAIFLLVIIIAQGIIAILLFISKEGVKGRLLSFGNEIFETASNSDATTLRTITNSVQQQFECCGWSGVEDYGLTSLLSLPSSCCHETAPYGHLLEGKCTLEYASPGCERKVEEFYKTWDKHMVATAIAIVCVEVVCTVLALYFAYSFRKRNRRSYFW